jgi:hypothetical protein
MAIREAYPAWAAGFLKGRVAIQPKPDELDAFGLEGLHFAGATEADWAKAKTAATADVIPLGSAPQPPGYTANEFTQRLVSGSTSPVVPIIPALEDSFRKYPFELHGREVIGRHPWKAGEAGAAGRLPVRLGWGEKVSLLSGNGSCYSERPS